MKKILTAVFPLVLCVSVAQATVYLSDDYSTFVNGDLVGQNGWTQTGATATNPIQILNGEVVMGTAGGQDAYKGFTSTATATAGTTLYTVFSLSVTSATATGDYFLHLSNPLGTTSNFYERVSARSSGSGFEFGLVDTSGTGSTITWGGTELAFGTDYDVIVAWNFLAGATNDTFTMYVDGTQYLTHTWTSALAEPGQLEAANFRQGSSTNSPGVTVYSLEVTDVNPIPEPGTFALLGATCFGVLLARRRRQVA